MPSLRLFLALPLPLPVRAVVARLAAPRPGFRWTLPEQLHVTLRFLGDVDTGRVDDLIAHFARIRVERFLLPVEGVGAFPPKGPPRVLWVGTGSGHPRLFQLRQKVDDTLLSAGLDVDLRTFHPHITVARCTEEGASAAQPWLRTHQAFEGPPFSVESFDLMSSELAPDGARHHVIAAFPLTGTASR